MSQFRTATPLGWACEQGAIHDGPASRPSSATREEATTAVVFLRLPAVMHYHAHGRIVPAITGTPICPDLHQPRDRVSRSLDPVHPHAPLPTPAS